MGLRFIKLDGSGTGFWEVAMVMGFLGEGACGYEGEEKEGE